MTNPKEYKKVPGNPQQPMTIPEKKVIDAPELSTKNADEYKKNNADPTKDEAQLKKERRRERAAKSIAALSDGMMALSNLFFVNRGAKNSYDGSKTLTASTQARYDRMKKDYEERKKEYSRGLQKAKEMDNVNAMRNFEAKLKADAESRTGQSHAMQMQLAVAKENRDREMAELNKKLAENQITKSGYDAKVAEINAKYAEQEKKASLALMKANAAKVNAETDGGKYILYNGKQYRNKENYKIAVLSDASNLGISLTKEISVVNPLTGEYTKKVINKSIEEIAVEVVNKQNKQIQKVGEREPNRLGFLENYKSLGGQQKKISPTKPYPLKS